MDFLGFCLCGLGQLLNFCTFLGQLVVSDLYNIDRRVHKINGHYKQNCTLYNYQIMIFQSPILEIDILRVQIDSTLSCMQLQISADSFVYEFRMGASVPTAPWFLCLCVFNCKKFCFGFSIDITCHDKTKRMSFYTKIWITGRS